MLVALMTFIISEGSAQTIKQITVSSLESRIKSGKDTVYVINFWATWCKPCIIELPYFEKLSTQYKSRPLKVLLVNVDAKSKLESSVKAFVQKNNLKNEVLHLSEIGYASKINKKWVGALPATLFWNAKTGEKTFHGKALTYDEILKLYKDVEI